MSIKGYWYSAESSKRLNAHLVISGDFYELSIDSDEGSLDQNRSGKIELLNVSDRVGNIPRKIYWPDESLFETTDNDSIDAALLNLKGTHQAASFIDKIEKNTSWVIAAVIITVIFTGGFFKFGLPYLANKVAFSIPVKATEHISVETLSTLDRFVFEETSLPEHKQQEITQRFNKLTESVDRRGFNFKLHFRRMQGLPNAMALPGGDIVVTDAFIKLASTPEEVDAVLLHEIGHVVERHGLTQVIQASTVSVVVAVAVGDASGASDLMVGIPTMLMQSSYSRDAESRADEYAFAQMAALDIDPIHFANIIRSLGNAARRPDSKPAEENSTTSNDSEAEVEVVAKVDDGKESKSVVDYLSSHPQTAARAKRAIEMSEQFRARGN